MDGAFVGAGCAGSRLIPEISAWSPATSGETESEDQSCGHGERKRRQVRCQIVFAKNVDCARRREAAEGDPHRNDHRLYPENDREMLKPEEPEGEEGREIRLRPVRQTDQYHRQGNHHEDGADAAGEEGP